MSSSARAGSLNRALKFLLLCATLLLYADPAGAASWTDPDYLYRYFTWGPRRLLSPRSDDYKSYGFHVIENGPDPFHFAAGNRALLPSTVEYHDGEDAKQVDLTELLRSSKTHAFIVLRDNELLDEEYFNGFARDSLCTTWSVSKSVTSALVGIAIADGYIKSVDDPITGYLPELKGQGFDSIAIKNLLTMGSGIRYRFGFFPWDEFVMVGYYPNLTQLMLTDLRPVEPPGQSFHYNNFNTELVGLILQRATHRPPSKYLEEKIWKPLGMEYPATWSIDSDRDNLEIMPTMLNARAIDLAKFGRLYLNNGNWDGKQIVSSSWVAESTIKDPSDNRPWETYSRWQDGGGYYKYFWWGVSGSGSDYSFMGIGTYGQFTFVSPRTKVVIVRTADDDGIEPFQWREVFQYIADVIAAKDQPTRSSPQ